jgi:hypothetical protein
MRFPPPARVFAAQWFLAKSEQCDKVDVVDAIFRRCRVLVVDAAVKGDE